ncbi:HD domain-containing protein [Marinitoga hydrogenitolerans DSM 16785]|uniref:HD domain-containing protein n=1 Tax=Marinitoga hydrogenitolerans (strain DSM 16785 / JCM 12826 / AT1271) TaxID=1122195 RepID=A0A1M4UIL5_MARH1|nr:HD-GYP domain-containing protein [Marinitoga hydrogenitolerans]SHE56537.1 HD domain-containing protein [Marinitoga hydrogenitolerans DSM 16785]
MNYEKKYEELRMLKEELEDAYEQLEYSYKELEELNNRFVKVVDLISNISIDVSMEKYFNKILSVFVELLPEVKYGCILKKEDDVFRFISIFGHSKKLYYNIAILKEKIDEIKLIENFYYNNIKNINVIKDKIMNVEKSLVIPIKTFTLHGYIILDLVKNNFKQHQIELIRVISNIASTFFMSRELYNKQKKYLKNTAFAFLKAIDYYDPYTKGHSERVSYYATSLAKTIGKENIINDIFLASALHDIGKLSIPQTILLKKEKLTKEEYEKIKEHPIKGEELVNSFEGFERIGKIIRHHHERWDGKGYPDGLNGEEIPLESRIITIADAFDAITTTRPYRKAFAINEAISELRRSKGKQFDPYLTEEFIKFLKINSFLEEV